LNMYMLQSLSYQTQEMWLEYQHLQHFENDPEQQMSDMEYATVITAMQSLIPQTRSYYAMISGFELDAYQQILLNLLDREILFRTSYRAINILDTETLEEVTGMSQTLANLWKLLGLLRTQVPWNDHMAAIFHEIGQTPQHRWVKRGTFAAARNALTLVFTFFNPPPVGIDEQVLEMLSAHNEQFMMDESTAWRIRTLSLRMDNRFWPPELTLQQSVRYYHTPAQVRTPDPVIPEMTRDSTPSESSNTATTSIARTSGRISYKTNRYGTGQAAEATASFNPYSNPIVESFENTTLPPFFDVLDPKGNFERSYIPSLPPLSKNHSIFAAVNPTDELEFEVIINTTLANAGRFIYKNPTIHSAQSVGWNTRLGSKAVILTTMREVLKRKPKYINGQHKWRVCLGGCCRNGWKEHPYGGPREPPDDSSGSSAI
jgi:hypothetical protein